MAAQRNLPTVLSCGRAIFAGEDDTSPIVPPCTGHAHSTPSSRSAASCSAVSLSRLDLVLLYQMPSLVSVPSGKTSTALRGTGPCPSRSNRCVRAVRPRWNAACALLGPLPPHAWPLGRETGPRLAVRPASTAAPAARGEAAPRCPGSSAASATCPGRRPRTAPRVRCRGGGCRHRPGRRGRGSGVASRVATRSSSPGRSRPVAARARPPASGCGVAVAPAC